MILNRWYSILESRAVRWRPIGVQRLGERLVLWRDGAGNIACMRDRCPHRGAALSGGRIVAGRLECPWHGFQYEGGGRCVLTPCSGRGAKIPRSLCAETYPVRERYGLIWLWWGEPRAHLPPVPWFDELPDDLSAASGLGFEAPYPWERMIESNLDIHHTPFVHHWTIPGVGTLLDPMHVEVDGEMMRCRGCLRKDDGRPAAESPGMPFGILARLPNLILLELTPKLRLFVVATPMDEERTWIFGRYYQDYTRLPVLRKLIAWLSVEYDWRIVQRGDWRVFSSLREPHFDRHAFRLVPADQPIIEFFKLIEQAHARTQEVRQSG
jgi:phenylpropionate dioxygenase-like ring-hydroxylating dioxygenase large terminal subunit